MRALAVLAVFGGGVAHGSLASLLRVGDVVPDIPLVVVVMLALRRGPEFGCVAGLIAGLLAGRDRRGASSACRPSPRPWSALPWAPRRRGSA